MQKITPFLWFDNNLEEAIELYTSIFKDAKILESAYPPEGAPGAKDKLLVATFQIAGQQFMGMNGGPGHPFTDATSFVVNCDTQEEIDYYWEKLTANGGQEIQCGWLKDKFGVSWQIYTPILGKLLGDADREKASRVMQAMMQMVKIDIADIIAASEG